MGYRVYDKVAQSYTSADAPSLPTLAGSNQFQLAAGEKVRVTAPDGSVYEAGPDANFADMTKQGFQLEPYADKVKREQLEQAAQHPVLAAGLGTLRGASFGLSDVGLAGIDQAVPGVKQQVENLKEANPKASFGGEVGGVVGSSLLLPGGGLAGLASDVGAATTAKVAGQLGVDLGSNIAIDAALTGGAKTMSIASQLAARAAAKGAGSALEGALFSTGQTISEAALGNPEDAADNFVANAGYGALFGGLIGGVPQVFGDLYRGKVGGFAKGQISDGMNSMNELTKAVQGAPDSAGDKLSQGFLEKEPAEFRQKALDYSNNPDQAKTAFVDTITGLNKASNDLSYAISKDAKDNLIKDFGEVEGLEAKKVAADVFDTIKINKKAVQDILESPDAELHDRPTLNKIVALSNSALDKLDKFDHIESGGTVGDVFDILNKHRKEMDNFNQTYLKEGPANPLTGTKGYSKKIVNNVLGNLRQKLVNEDSFGVLASTNKEINSAVKNFIDSNQNFVAKFGEKLKVNGKTQYVMSPTKISNFLNDQTALRNSIKDKVFENHFDAIQKLIDVTKNHNITDFFNDLPQNTKDVLNNAQQMKSSLQDIRAAVAGISKMQATTGARLSGTIIGSQLGSMVGSVIGGPVGGHIGSAAGSAIGHMISSPLTRFKVLTKIERAILNNKNDTAETLNKFFSGEPIKAGLTKNAIRAGSLDTMAQTVANWNQRPDQKKADKVKSSVPKIMHQITQTTPETMMNNVQSHLEGMSDAAPHVAMATSLAGLRALQFLQSKAPQNTLAGSDIIPQNKPLPMSGMQENQIKRYIETITNPSDTVNKMVKNTLTADHIEALKAVYPSLYQQIQQQTVAAMTANHENISYAKKLQVGTLLGVPTVAAMSPGFLTSIQSMYHLPQPQPHGKVKETENSPAKYGATNIQQAMM